MLNLCELVLSQASAPGPLPGSGAHPGIEITDESEKNSIKYSLDKLEGQGNLFAMALKVTGLYGLLTSESYPFVVLFVPSTNDELERYLAAQGLTPKTFIEHPKLRQFMESHLVMHRVNTGDRKLNRKRVVVEHAINDYRIVFRSEASYKPKSQNNRLNFANGIYFGLDCLYSGPEISTAYYRSFEGQICFVKKPIVKDFDWTLTPNN